MTGSRMYEPWWPTWLIQLAQSQGAIIISPDHRLMPEASPSEVLDDVASFWTWYTGNLPNIAFSDSWDVQPDLERTICVGQSSGAFLTMHSALEHPDLRLRAVAALYGPLAYDIPSLSIPKPRVVAGAKPLPPRQAEGIINSYVAKNKGSIRISGDPAEEWELVAAVAQQRWMSRNMKKYSSDHRLNLVANVKSKQALPPTWVVHGEQDTMVCTF